MNILGINAYHGNASAAILCDGKLIAAVEEERFNRVEHHIAHLASAFYCSQFERAALLSADGLGDFASSMWGAGFGGRMNIHGSIAFPHSLGLYYSAVTQYLGFLKFGDEYKVMGLAAYGQTEQLELFHDILRVEKGSAGNGFKLGLEYFSHHRTGPEMSWAEADKTPRLGKLFSEGMERRLGSARAADQTLEQRHRNLAASLQARLEEVYLGMLRRFAERTRLKSVCLAGGVAFNCVANGKIFEATPFEQVYVQPAAGDGGLSVGAAFFVWHQVLGQPRSLVIDHAYC